MITVDASVAIKWLNQNEEDSSVALVLYEKHIAGVEKIVVPSFSFVEIANYLATKSHTSKQHIKEGLHVLFASQFIIHEPTERELGEAAQMAKEYKTSAYDMLYAVVARTNESTPITADEKFAEKVAFSFVKSIKRLS